MSCPKSLFSMNANVYRNIGKQRFIYDFTGLCTNFLQCDGLRPCGFCKQNNVDCVFDAQMVPLGTVEQSLLYLPEFKPSSTATCLTSPRSVKLLSDRVANIEQYLREASDRDRVGRLSPKFRDSRQNSLVDSDQSRCTVLFTLVRADLPQAEQHLIEPGGEGVTAVANIDESRSTEYYGMPFPVQADSQAPRVL